MLFFLGATTTFLDGSADFYKPLEAPGHAHDDNSTAVKVLLTDYAAKTGAKCLDGTPAAYYYRKGVGDGANKWYIHHQGGGWCENLDDCLGRSHTGLGSSNGYPNATGLNGGYFDPHPVVNPMMYNWNMVWMRYCDGGSFSGNNETVTTYKSKQLFFRGKRVREAVYDSLIQEYGLGHATDAVISGCSAGGLATFIHTDQWCDALKRDADSHAGVKCVGMPDSGFFLDYQYPGNTTQATTAVGASQLGNTPSGTYHSGLKWLFSAMNTTSGLNQDCVASKVGLDDDHAYLCQFAEHTSVFTHTPLFPLQSEYDSWQTSHVLHYPNTGADVQVLGDNITRRLSANLLSPHPQSGAFLDSCWHHCGMWNQIRIDGELVSVAFAKWYDGLGKDGTKVPPKALWRQGEAYECKACCHATSV